jgi:hypothetical protein
MKYKDIHAKWFAEKLIEKGHVPFKVTANKKQPRFNVYVFENTAVFDKDMSEITLERHKTTKK